MLDRAAAYGEAGADAIWLGLRTPQDYAKAADMVKKPLMAVVGNANIPATPAAMKTARVSVGQATTMMSIALGAVDRALVELKGTGRMVEAQMGALGVAMSDRIEQVEELNARSAKYNLPRSSGRQTR
jgi:2-methylisocitrate lyase-like PEP mutase family enzyme